MNESEIHRSTESIIQAFKSVRQLLLSHAGNIEADQKADGSPITTVDVEVEDRVTTYMLEHSPTTPVYGEEGGYSETLPKICWVIDPIDGTTSFVAGAPYFTCMAALIIDDDAVAGVVYDPTTDNCYTGFKHEGAFKNGERIDLSKKPLAKVAYCKGRFITDLDALLASADIHCEIPPEGVGSNYIAILEGTAAARFQLLSRGHIHDYAPGMLLVSEAGGSVQAVQKDSWDIHTKSFVLSHPEAARIIKENIDTVRASEIAHATPDHPVRP